MILRTPRRRISPQTKRRYRAIRDFFHRALGSSSQPDIHINSTIAVNVTDLKHKIIGLEHQLDEVSRHCRDYACLETSSRKSDIFFDHAAVKQKIGPINEQTDASSEVKFNGSETKVIYKSKNTKYNKISEDNVYLPKTIDQDIVLKNTSNNIQKESRIKNNINKSFERDLKLQKHKTENFKNTNSDNSFRSLAISQINIKARHPKHHNERKYFHAEPHETNSLPRKERKHKFKNHLKKSEIENIQETLQHKTTKMNSHKHRIKQVDPDYIADIIRRQYKPVKMFGRRESDISQVSAPVCRDQEYSLREDIVRGSELCSCCYDQHPTSRRHHGVRDMKSICDTRLYSSNKRLRPKYQRTNLEHYNNAEFYDLVPVKEKSSPKTRRKFMEENLPPPLYYREVPPSPRTLRPRLNLTAQYNTESEDHRNRTQYVHKVSPNTIKRCDALVQNTQSDVSSNLFANRNTSRRLRKMHKKIQSYDPDQSHQNASSISSLQYPSYVNEHINTNIDRSLNKTLNSEVNVDKTDKTLSEIKDLLQSFLQEIKKEANGLSDSSSKNCDNVTRQQSSKINVSNVANTSHNNVNNGVGHIPTYIPSPAFTNPCCYPVMPMCPINCPMPMQNSFMMPTQSFTCTNCANTSKDQNEQCNNKDNGVTHSTETEALIKEIYKFVAQGSCDQKKYNENRHYTNHHDPYKIKDTILTSRSAGASSFMTSRHDAKVGTPPLTCYSKSCEAIGSKLISNEYYSGITNTSYSDTVIEKIGLETSTSETGIATESSTIDKTKLSKFQKVLNSIGLFKNKKKHVIEELSESESTVEVKVTANSPYRQNVTNYMMHGQEYFHPPPIASYCPGPHVRHPHCHSPQELPSVKEHDHPPVYEIYSPRNPLQRISGHPTSPLYYPKNQYTAPSFHSPHGPHYTHEQPPEVCLKEIEVKSRGTQSDRKMTLFHKITKKIQPAAGDNRDNQAKACSTQTKETDPKPTVKSPFMSKWKSLKEKAMEDLKKNPTDTITFSLKKQKELAEGDMRMRNAMLKKIFHKRNPFSPRNMLVKTLMGKDKTSYGDPRMTYRPRIFL